MRKLFAPIATLSMLTLASCVSPAGTSAIGSLAGTGGSVLAPKIASSKTATSVLSVACQNAGPILARYGATAWPAAAPFIPAASASFASFCRGALPNGTSTTTAAARLNTLFAIVLGSGLMN